MSVLKGTVIPGISCSHAWVAQTGKDRWTGATYNTGRQVCTSCEATCLRDKAGHIIEYEAPASEGRLPWAHGYTADDRLTRPDLSS